MYLLEKRKKIEGHRVIFIFQEEQKLPPPPLQISRIIQYKTLRIVLICHLYITYYWSPQGFWGEWLFIFRELGSTGNYFRGSREQAHNFGDIGSLSKKAKKKKNKEKPPLCLFKKIHLLLGRGVGGDPLVNYKCIYFHTYMIIELDLREKYGN